MAKPKWKEKKNQHYVPQGYLRKFTIHGEKSLIWAIDKAKAEYLKIPSSVNKICAADYYYYQISENGEIDHTALEDSFSEVERVGIGTLNKVINSSAMPCCSLGEDQGNLAFFLALLLTRGPESGMQ